MIVALFSFFSLASGVGSVAFKDVLVKTIPKWKRGRLLAARATFGGLLTLITGSILGLYIVDSLSLVPYLITRRVDYSGPCCRRDVPSAPGSP